MGQTFKEQLTLLREDWQTNGRSLRNRAIWAMAIYRYGQWVNQLRPTPVKWVLNGFYAGITIFCPIFTGMALDRNTKVGRRLHIVHPAMILIHPAAVIGDCVGLMHGVTLGTTPTNAGAPTIGNDVFIGCHTSILGPIKIGNGAMIAANSLVVCDVPAGATAIGVPAKIYPAAIKPVATRTLSATHTAAA